MATYNFTVRATDNLGAYADQNFSLTVNNTNIERWCVVGSTGLAHSSDGVNWTVESGVNGGRVAYGNGKWVVYNGPQNYFNSLGLNIRTSTDAFNWTTVASGLPATYTVPAATTCINTSTSIAANTTYNLAFISSLKYLNNTWTAFVVTNSLAVTGGGTSMILEYTSPDLVTWTFKSASGINSVANANTPAYLNDHYVDLNGNAVVQYYIAGANLPYISSRAAGASILTNYVTGSSGGYAGGAISYINGLYCVANGVSGSVYTSIDGIGWTARTVVASNWSVGFSYANGRLLTRVAQTSTGTAVQVYYSLNGGRTWTAGGSGGVGATTVAVSSMGSLTQNSAYYGGRMIILKGTADAAYHTTTDSGTTMSFETGTIGTQIGSAYGIAVRV